MFPSTFFPNTYYAETYFPMDLAIPPTPVTGNAAIGGSGEVPTPYTKPRWRDDTEFLALIF